MQQTNFHRILRNMCVVMAAFLSCCYSSVDPASEQPETSENVVKEEVTGKRAVLPQGKKSGKRIFRGTAAPVTATKDPSLPVSVAAVGKQPVLPEVQTALLDMASRSSEPMKISIDPTLGTVRRFTGNLANIYEQSTEGAVAYLKDNIAALGLSSDASLNLEVIREIIDDNGARHVVVSPAIGDLPVWMTQATLHLDADGNVRSLYAENLAPISVDATVRFDGDAAVTAATEALGPLSSDGNVETVTEPELGILPAGGGEKATYGWRFFQRALEADGTPQYYETYVDAKSGKIAARYPTTVNDALIPATGSVVNNLGVTESLRVSVSEEQGIYVLYDQSRGTASGEILTFNANNEYSVVLNGSTLVASSNANQWDTIGGSVHANLQKTIDYYLNTHGRNSWDGQGAQVRGIVHFGQEYVNAYWSGRDHVMVFGDGDGSQYMALGGALDVVAHEFTHAVVSATANLVYANQSGALNESYADVLSVMVDRDDWLQGEDIIGPNNPAGAARSLAEPALYGHPAHMDDYQDITWDHGGVHINCLIPSHAAYLAATNGSSREAVEKVWYRTLNQGHIGRLSNFRDQAEGSLVACNELREQGSVANADCNAILDAWVSVGLLTEATDAGCPENATEQDGLCYCNDGFAPSIIGNQCVAEGSLNCPEHSVEANGQCFCEDGYRVPPSDDTAAPMTCELEENACPLNSHWDETQQKCVCNDGFEGDADGMDGGCNVVTSDCPANSHPVWQSNREENPDDYICECNDGFEYVGYECVVPEGGCGNETFYGRCDGNTLIYCADGIQTADCGGAGLICDLFDSRIGFDCLNPGGLGEAATCDADGYQECGANNPFCVAEESAEQGFCTKECKVNDDCGDAYACCGTVSDGTRACLTAPYCDNVVDTKATCSDVAGGSAFYGDCDGNVLVYCDGSTSTTQQVNCPKLGQVCRFVDEETGYNCVADDAAAALVAPPDWCPYENDGVCDVPASCPDGSDLFDCNPCGAVTANGQCTGNVLALCDASLGLVQTDCSTLAATPQCVVGQDGTASCAAAGDTDSDTVSDTAADTDTDTATDTATASEADTASDTDTNTTATDTATDTATGSDADTASDSDTTAEEEEDKSASCSCTTVGHNGSAALQLLSLLLSII